MEDMKTRIFRELGITPPKPWAYLDNDVADEARPLADNPSGLYCPTCRGVGAWHCSEPEYCGGMKKMRGEYQPKEAEDNDT